MASAPRSISFRRMFAPWLVVALCLVVFGCSERNAGNPAPVLHNAACHIWPDSVDFHNGVIVRAASDSVLQVRVEGNVIRSIPVPPAGETAFTLSSGFPVVDALFRVEAARPCRSRWHVLAPYEIFLNPFAVSAGTGLLESRLKNGLVVPVEGRRYSWPVVNDNAAWLLAASELCKVGGTRRWLRTLGDVAANAIGEDCRMARNPSTGLFYGLPRYMAGGTPLFPGWMDASDIFQVQTLAVNVLYWAALSGLEGITRDMARRNERSHLPQLPVDADSLRHCINREMWMPNIGVYSAMLYGSPLWPLQLRCSDNIAQAMAVVTGMASPAMSASVLRNTPVAPSGIEPLTPRPHCLGAGSPHALAAQALWAPAAAVAGNGEAYESALGYLLLSSASGLLSGNGDDGTQILNPIAGWIVRGLLGLRFSFDGIFFSPSVPGVMAGTKRITGIRYRRSIIDINLSGTGNVIASFAIDGKPSSPFFPANASEGRHVIDITLSGTQLPGQMTNDNVAALPPAPPVEWNGPRDAAVLPPSALDGTQRGKNASPAATFVYLNGVLTEELLSHSYHLYDAGAPVMVQFVSVVDNRLVSFSSAPHLFVPAGAETCVPLPEVARTGTKVIEDRRLAERFVESDRFRNRVIRFGFTAPADGDYLIDVHYVSGLGVVNPRRRTALRTLAVDGARSGVFVFPQRSNASAPVDGTYDWQTLTSFSNPLRITLEKGAHNMELRLYQPSPVYIDPTANTLLADFIRIISLGSSGHSPTGQTGSAGSTIPTG